MKRSHDNIIILILITENRQQSNVQESEKQNMVNQVHEKWTIL